MRTLIYSCCLIAFGILFTQCGGNSYMIGIDGQGDLVNRQLKLDDFTGMHLSISGTVYLEQGPQRVEISAQENILNNITTTVDGGIWKIKMSEPARNYKDVTIRISIPELSHASVNGSGDIIGESSFNNLNDLAVKISGSGGIVLDVDAQAIDAGISGSGDIALGGTANSLEMGISGSGDIEAFDLAVNDCEIRVSGSGNCEVNVKDNLDVKVSGSGDVYYKGRPAIKSRVSGSGELHASD